MSFNILDTVVLLIDLPDSGLEAGDLGAIVEIYDSDTMEVEFVTGSGDTRALVTLSRSDVRPIGPGDMPAVRSLGAPNSTPRDARSG